MLIAAAFACGGLGVAIERYAYRPLRTAPRFAPLITALGVSFLLQNSALLVFGGQYRSYGSYELDNGRLATGGIHLGVLNISTLRIFVVTTAVLLMITLHLFVRRTRVGGAIRATAVDPEAAVMVGIDVDHVIAVTFFIASALAGIAGVIVGLVFNNVYHYMGFTAGLKGFTASVVGGIGSIPGAMLGGFLIGLLESYATGYMPQGATFQDLWIFIVLIVFLLLRPNGLLGQPAIKKV
jgi:branched-chain amino acid transport system permease protein